jgi:hypothetical protein
MDTLETYFTDSTKYDLHHLLILDFRTLRSMLKKLWNIQSFVSQIGKTLLNKRDPDTTTDFEFLDIHF